MRPAVYRFFQDAESDSERTIGPNEGLVAPSVAVEPNARQVTFGDMEDDSVAYGPAR